MSENDILSFRLGEKVYGKNKSDEFIIREVLYPLNNALRNAGFPEQSCILTYLSNREFIGVRISFAQNAKDEDCYFITERNIVMDRQRSAEHLRHDYLHRLLRHYRETNNKLDSLKHQLSLALIGLDAHAERDMREDHFLPVTGTFLQRSKAIQDEIDRLTASLPCEAFAKQFNWELHEAFKAKYPINSSTVVAKWQFHIDHLKKARYRRYPTNWAGVFIGDEVIPSATMPHAEEMELQFEWWAFPMVLLCYEPFENKVWFSYDRRN